MSVRKIIFSALAVLLLFTGAVLAFPHDPNPSTIDSVRFPGDWTNTLRSLNVDNLRILQFMIEEFKTTGAGKGGARDLNIWNSPSFSPDKVSQDEATWEHLLNNPGSAVPASVGRSLMTTHDELVAFIEAMPKTNLTVEYLGEIPRGFPFPFLIFSMEKDRTPAGLASTGKPLVWIQGAIHGGEWSGGEAALTLANDLARGRYDNLLNKVNVVMTPRINGDGVKRPIRTTDDLLALQWTPTPEARDLNRDNVLLDLHVSRVMKKMFAAYSPHFCVDLHERGATNIVSAITNRYGLKFDSDAGDIGPAGSQILQIPKEITRIRFEYMEKDLAKFGEQFGLTFGLYREGTDTHAHGQSNNYASTWANWTPQPGEPSAGPYAEANYTGGFITNQAWDPDAPYYLLAEPAYITRTANNINAMPGVVSQLFENKSGPTNVGNRGMWERRVATAYVCCLSTITTAANRAEELMPMISNIRKQWLEKGKTVTSDDMVAILMVPEKPTFWNDGKPEIGYEGREVGYTAIDITGLPTTITSMSIKAGVQHTIRYDVTKALKYVGLGMGLPNTKNNAYIAVSDDSGTRDYQIFKFERTWLGWAMRERIRPYAYIFEGQYANELATRMMLAGIKVKRLAEDVTIDVEGWHYNRTPFVNLADGGSTGWLNRDVTVYGIKNREFKKDAFVVYLAQPLVHLIPIYMEPDISSNVASCIFLPYMSVAAGGASTGSLSPTLVGVEMPAYRYLKTVDLPTYDVNHFLPLVNRGAVVRFFSYHTQDDTAAVSAACGEKYIKVYDYDFQVHTRTDALVGGRFDIDLPTSNNTTGYLILSKSGYQKLATHGTMSGWNIGTVVVADHGLAPFTIDLNSMDQPIVGDGSNRTLPKALPATDDLIGVRIVELLEKPISSIFIGGVLPPDYIETEDGFEYTKLISDKGTLLSDSMLDGWKIVGVAPHSGSNWKAFFENGKLTIKFSGDAFDQVVTVTLENIVTGELMDIDILFAGEKESIWDRILDKAGCNGGIVMLALFAVLPMIIRRKVK
ncbi:MAG: hypothetical protein FWF87_03730 [Synergistaceae bacterium]|nr:hypothetical protein [Synergistaceae bacterium]